MIDISVKLEKLLEEEEIAEYEDEKIFSNLYMISLPTSLRKLESMKESRDYEQKKAENEWLRETSPESEQVSAISFDCLKMKLRPEAHSCDGFMYYAGNDTDKISILFEMKKVNKSKMLQYIASRDEESILEKVKDSVLLLQEDIEFSGCFTGKELIEHTHLLLIYGGKADTVSEASLGIGKKEKVKRDKTGRQIRAARLSPGSESQKRKNEIFKRLGEELKKKGRAPCKKGYFGIPVRDPEWEKRNGEKILDFTMLSKEDMREVIENVRFFDRWDWGVYCTYLCDEEESDVTSDISDGK